MATRHGIDHSTLQPEALTATPMQFHASRPTPSTAILR
jgi:hypothetical protein